MHQLIPWKYLSIRSSDSPSPMHSNYGISIGPCPLINDCRKYGAALIVAMLCWRSGSWTCIAHLPTSHQHRKHGDLLYVHSYRRLLFWGITMKNILCIDRFIDYLELTSTQDIRHEIIIIKTQKKKEKSNQSWSKKYKTKRWLDEFGPSGKQSRFMPD